MCCRLPVYPKMWKTPVPFSKPVSKYFKSPSSNAGCDVLDGHHSNVSFAASDTSSHREYMSGKLRLFKMRFSLMVWSTKSGGERKGRPLFSEREGRPATELADPGCHILPSLRVSEGFHGSRMNGFLNLGNKPIFKKGSNIIVIMSYSINRS